MAQYNNTAKFSPYGTLESYDLIFNGVTLRIHSRRTLSIVGGNVTDLALYLFNNTAHYAEAFANGMFYFESMLFANISNGRIAWHGIDEPDFLEDLQKAFSKICSMKAFL